MTTRTIQVSQNRQIKISTRGRKIRIEQAPVLLLDLEAADDFQAAICEAIEEQQGYLDMFSRHGD